MPLESQLEAIEELGLSRFDKLQVDTAIPQEPRWNDPVITACMSDVWNRPNSRVARDDLNLYENILNQGICYV